jgi:hypothetical protein
MKHARIMLVLLAIGLLVSPALAITTNCDGNVTSQTNIRNGIEDHSGNFINRNEDYSDWNCGSFDFGSLFGNYGGFGCR